MLGPWSLFRFVFQKLKESSKMGVLRKKDKYVQRKPKKIFPFRLEIALPLI